MTEIFLVDSVSLVYLVKEMSAKNQIDQTLVSLVYLVKEMSEANHIEQTLVS